MLPQRRAARLLSYDYATPGAYFVTICTQNRRCLFGEVENGEMRPNPAGEMILRWMNELPAKFPTVGIDSIVVMPNHLQRHPDLA
jgi:REP element-mobilizing transposase RayT